jgi:hypothetical protein
LKINKRGSRGKRKLKLTYKNINEMNYPTYYKLATRCLKRESDTTAIEVKIPERDQNLPTIHHIVTFPSKERLDEEVAKMEKIESEKYEEYLATLFQAMQKNREKYQQIKQERFDKLYPKPPHLAGSSEWQGWNPNLPKSI